MALGLLWSTRARNDLREIIDYIASDSESAAVGFKQRIDEVILPVLEHPYLFRPGRKQGTREIVVNPNYVVVYKVGLEHIEIVAVLHSRRQYP